MAAYVVLIFFSRWIWPQVPPSWRILIALLPVIPTIFVFVAIVRFTMAMDELQRNIVVHSLALAGGATALLSVTYGLLEGQVLPRPSAWCTYAVFMVCWLVASKFVSRRYR